MKFLRLFLLCFFIFAMTACTILTPPQEPKKQEEVRSPELIEEDRQNAADLALSKKLSPYIQCINMNSEKIYQSFQRYFSWTDIEKGPTGQEKAVYGIYEISDPETCIEAVTKASRLKPLMSDLETSGAAYVSALRKLYPLVTQAFEYYGQKKYEVDKMAQAKAMHAALRDGWKEFESADKALSGQIDKVKDGLDQRILAKIKKAYGEKIPYLTRYAFYLGKKVAIEGQIANLQDLKIDAFSEKISQFEKTLTRLEKYSISHPAEAKKAAIDPYIDAAKKFLTAANELLQRVKDNRAFSESEKSSLGTPAEWLIEGTPGKLIKMYNALVQTHNDLKFEYKL